MMATWTIAHYYVIGRKGTVMFWNRIHKRFMPLSQNTLICKNQNGAESRLRELSRHYDIPENKLTVMGIMLKAENPSDDR